LSRDDRCEKKTFKEIAEEKFGGGNHREKRGKSGKKKGGEALGNNGEKKLRRDGQSIEVKSRMGKRNEEKKKRYKERKTEREVVSS